MNSTEIWNLVNLTEDTHPIHLHLVRFQVLERRRFDADEIQTSGTMRWLGGPVPPEANELGWKDTVRAEASMVTSIIVRFEGFAGRYVWHCHVLEHAANEMMRPFEVVEASARSGAPPRVAFSRRQRLQPTSRLTASSSTPDCAIWPYTATDGRAVRAFVLSSLSTASSPNRMLMPWFHS